MLTFNHERDTQERNPVNCYQQLLVYDHQVGEQLRTACNVWTIVTLFNILQRQISNNVIRIDVVVSLLSMLLAKVVVVVVASVVRVYAAIAAVTTFANRATSLRNAMPAASEYYGSSRLFGRPVYPGANKSTMSKLNRCRSKSISSSLWKTRAEITYNIGSREHQDDVVTAVKRTTTGGRSCIRCHIYGIAVVIVKCVERKRDRHMYIHCDRSGLSCGPRYHHHHCDQRRSNRHGRRVISLNSIQFR